MLCISVLTEEALVLFTMEATRLVFFNARFALFDLGLVLLTKQWTSCHLVASR